MITVTLNQIKESNPCIDGWKKVLKANGGVNADMNKPFPLSSIIESNDLEDALWVIASVSKMEEHNAIWREFGCWCALQNVELIKPHCSGENYELILNWLTTQDESLRKSAALSAAWSAALSAALSAAESAAGSAALSAAWSAARSAAESATLSAARSASCSDARSVARSAQEQKLKELIG